MFGWRLTVTQGANFAYVDTEQERDPPPLPTSTALPDYKPFYASETRNTSQPAPSASDQTVDDKSPKNSAYQPRDWSPEQPPPDLKSHYINLKSVLHLEPEHLGCLNVTITPECALEDLIPARSHGAPFLPDRSWLDSLPDGQKELRPIFSTADPPDRNVFESRIRELRVDNDAAFRVITRTTKEGVTPPRLAHFRKFWESLESMSQYWDTSLDNYFQTQVQPKENEHQDGDDGAETRFKRTRLSGGVPAGRQSNSVDAETGASNDTTGDGAPANRSDRVGSHETDDGTTSSGEESTVTQTSSATAETPVKEASTQTSEAASVPLPPDSPDSNAPSPKSGDKITRYKGRRTSKGSLMPSNFRADTLRAFCEGVLWAFGCQVAPPRRQLLLRFDNMLLPIRLSAIVSRVPADRIKARSGWIQGPMMG
ncbi:hypothetical protein LTR66_014769, partial [Elasticomyces elasticus]